MVKDKMADRDERTVSIENASYAIGYKVAAFALLIDIAYRAFKKDEPSWDLFAIVISSSLIMLGYQLRHRILTKQCVKFGIMAIVAGTITAIIVAVLNRIVY